MDLRSNPLYGDPSQSSPHDLRPQAAATRSSSKRDEFVMTEQPRKGHSFDCSLPLAAAVFCIKTFRLDYVIFRGRKRQDRRLSKQKARTNFFFAKASG